jgi:hypothetical protein
MALPPAALEMTPVLLHFNNAYLEVDSSLARRRGGLRTLAREAETKWDLEPGSYDLLHAAQKMDSALDLQRALEATESGICKLEVVERPEGKMMRKVRADMALMEKRLMAKVEDSLLELRSKVADHSSKLDGAIAPMVQSIAMDHIDLRNTLAQLSSEVAGKIAQVEAEQLQTFASASSRHDDCNVLKQLEDLEMELQQDILGARAEHELLLHQEAYDEKELEKEVRCLEDVRPSFLQPAPGLSKKIASEAKLMSGNPDAWLQWPTQPHASLPYSSKSKAMPWPSKLQEGQEWQKWSYSGDVASFAQYNTLYTRSMKQVIGCRSCPLLPPLQ